MARTIPAVLKVDEDGAIFLRDGITVAFFLPMPLDAVADAVLAAFELYLASASAKTLRWCSLGADSEEFRPLDSRTFDRCRAMLSKEATRKRKLTAFEIFDGEQGGDAATNGFVVLGNPKDKNEPLEANLLQMYFPSDEVSTPAKADSFVGRVAKIAAALPFIYGYASPGLHWAESFEIEALTAARAIAKRYPGFDVQANETTRSDLDTMTRGARWLTFLGPQILSKLGGFGAVQSIAEGEITWGAVGHGVAVRAGGLPELGDRNRRLATPLLRAIAALLLPVTLFDEPALDETVFSLDDPGFLRTWERRFLDDS